MADNRRLFGYGLILNVLFLLTVYDLMAKGKSDHEQEERVQESVDKTLPEPKILNMRSGPAGPVLKFLYCYS
ncbi:hypothetical protein RvY_14657 [Ramazzottius varieornatus]|uniref:Uncharacterized protein n=1 Tax=Ramazzottius varieornatus TaxID=947166 RepID=A0A1D1W0G4_RAMVA|nr:hypothetical protein RvY_14657 [Ramazzottius varieornatus]